MLIVSSFEGVHLPGFTIPLNANTFQTDAFAMARLPAAPIRLACRPMRYAHTAFVLALARVTTRAYGSLAPAICDTRGALLQTGINIYV